MPTCFYVTELQSIDKFINHILPIRSKKATEARSKVNIRSKYNNSENFALPNITHDIPDRQKKSVRVSKLEKC